MPVTTSPPEPTTTAAPAKAGSSITASVGKDSIRYGDQASLEVSVQAPGAPAGTDLTGHVTFLDGTETIDEGDTDSSGAVTLSFLNRADPGSKTYTINYSGGAAVDASTAPLTVQTTQTNVDIAVDWADGLKPGDDATITVDIVGTPDSPTGDVTISYDGNQIADGPVDDNGKITAAANAVTAGDHQIKVSYAGDARFEPNTATSTLTVKDPVANPNAAGAAATQASNPVSGRRVRLRRPGKRAGLAADRRADHLRPGADHLRRLRFADPRWHVLGVLAGQEPQVQPVQQCPDAELGVLRQRHRVSPRQPVEPVQRLRAPVLECLGDVLRHALGGRRGVRVGLGPVLISTQPALNSGSAHRSRAACSPTTVGGPLFVIVRSARNRIRPALVAH